VGSGTSQLQTPSPTLTTGVVFDAHVHIQSGRTGPLPFLWSQNSKLKDKDRDSIDKTLSGFAAQHFANITSGVGDSGKIQALPIADIAAWLRRDAGRAMEKKGKIGSSKYHRSFEVFSPSVAMTWDMEFAHVGGHEEFGGCRIYHEEGKDLVCYQRTSGSAQEKDGARRVLPKNEASLFMQWKDQIKQNESATSAYPFELPLMFFYDPRRYCLSQPPTPSSDPHKGHWAAPFSSIAGRGNSNQQGANVGFKVYPPLGCKPMDDRCPHLTDFYERCAKDKIPIMTHCSPGGAPTHENRFYYEIESDSELAEKYRQLQKLVDDVAMALSAQGAEQYCSLAENRSAVSFFADQHRISSDPKTVAKHLVYHMRKQRIDLPLEYFDREFVHPRAWRPVLDQCKKRGHDLRLCLAHFGGPEWVEGIGGEHRSDWVLEIIDMLREYPGLYTDIACFDTSKFRNEFVKAMRKKEYTHVKDRLLFGSDWYMSVLVLRGKNYDNYCREMFDMLEAIEKNLWVRCSLINPYTFYGFDDRNLVANMAGWYDRSTRENKLLKDTDRDDRTRLTDERKQKLLALHDEVSYLRHLLSPVKSK